MMFSVYMIIAVLAAEALTKGSIECNFLQCNGTCQCRAAAGQPLIFHLTNKVDTSLILMKDDKDRILKRETRGKTVKISDEYKKEFEDLNNGKVKLRNAAKKHSGNYLLEEHGSDGVLQRNVTVHLEVQAPASKPAVSQTCLSSEQMKVSCSSEGDRIESTLTLDGQFLIQTRDQRQSLSSWLDTKSSVWSVSINLYGQLTGNLKCEVKNNVSRDETVLRLEACKDVSTFVVVAVTVSAVMLLLFVALCLYIYHRKTMRPTPVNVDRSEDEIVYTDVQIRGNTRKDEDDQPQNAT
ncbi:uncharacterized protein LOC125021416 [Mugil cephalus]|uniref:uncharacterized protein LOC125021416 n=1 Tax=Mugil cephalus TaxID=48193 RepID=UPI001FB75868|nr:uncharacterized protein LOC125021416 [Mugil cephalus]